MFGADKWMFALPLLLMSCGGDELVTNPVETGDRIAAMVLERDPAALDTNLDRMRMHSGAEILVEVGAPTDDLCLPSFNILDQSHPDLGPYVIPGQEAIQRDADRTSSFIRMFVDCRTNQTARVRCELEALEAIASMIEGYPGIGGPLSVTFAR